MFLRYDGRVLPFALRNIERVIVLENVIIVASVYQYLVSVHLHRVESSPIWYNLLEVDSLKLIIQTE